MRRLKDSRYTRMAVDQAKEANRIVVPDDTHQVAVDPDTYVDQMKEGRGEAVSNLFSAGLLLVVFLVLVIALTALELPFAVPLALILSLGGAGVVWMVLRRQQMAQKHKATKQYHEAYELEKEAKRLEAEIARQSGKFDHWEKS